MAERLPIYEIETQLISAVGSTGRVLVSAPTGSGKSTQIPQMMLGLAGSGQIVVLQPRRLAARLLARRVARERKSELGHEVGYQIRFENVTSPRTRIRFVTEGILLRQMLNDPDLAGVSIILFDEFHERHLEGDIALARALELQSERRPDLKILVMSATLDTARFEDFLRPCQTLSAQGRSFPIEIEYAGRPSYLEKRPIWEQAAEAATDFVMSSAEGDVLVFMPGAFEIAQTIEAIRRRDSVRGLILLPLHGELGAPEQDAAVARYDARKVVVATNVAETSLTIEGIRCVIDSGLARMARYDPYRGINTLLIEKISRASTDQRAGRAGRTAPGICKRLWAEEEQAHRPPQDVPEIKRMDLAEAVLALKAAGIRDVRKFRWLEPPEEKAVQTAEQLLTDLGALVANDAPNSGSITTIGRTMLAFPVHPRYARMLLAAQQEGCVYQCCLIAALTQGRDLLIRKAHADMAGRREDLVGRSAGSDFFLLMNAWEHAVQQGFKAEVCGPLGIHAGAARQIEGLLRQFLDIARKEGLDATRREAPETSLRKCILIGFSDRVARRIEGNRFELVHGRRGTLSRESTVQGSVLIAAAEIHEVEGRDKSVQTVLSLVTSIDEAWLYEMFSGDIERRPRIFYNAQARRVYAEEEIQFRGLAIGSRAIEPPPADEASKLLAEQVLKGNLILEQWDEGVEQWILRLNLLSQWCPELTLPSIGEAERSVLVEEICHGEFSYKAIKDKPVRSIVMGWLSGPQQHLVEKHAPERLKLPNGRNPKVIYASGSPPHIAMRIQELFEVNATPRIAMGRVPVLVHILAPSRRPVQITQDLAGFWKDHYPRVKRELQRKYPKHEWR